MTRGAAKGSIVRSLWMGSVIGSMCLPSANLYSLSLPHRSKPHGLFCGDTIGIWVYRFFHRIIITGDSTAGFSQSLVHMGRELISIRSTLTKWNIWMGSFSAPKSLMSLRHCTISSIPNPWHPSQIHDAHFDYRGFAAALLPSYSEEVWRNCGNQETKVKMKKLVWQWCSR